MVVFHIGEKGTRASGQDDEVGQGRRRAAALALVLAAVGAVACSSGSATPTIATVVDEGFGTSSPFTLIVSNQSFEDPSVRIVATIDGAVAVDQAFDVGSQHDYRYFSFDLPSGAHDVSVTGGGHAGTAHVEVIGRANPRWLLVTHWDDRIELKSFDEQPLFA